MCIARKGNVSLKSTLGCFGRPTNNKQSTTITAVFEAWVEVIIKPVRNGRRTMASSSFEAIMDKFLEEFNSKTDDDFSKEFTVSSVTYG